MGAALLPGQNGRHKHGGGNRPLCHSAPVAAGGEKGLPLPRHGAGEKPEGTGVRDLPVLHSGRILQNAARAIPGGRTAHRLRGNGRNLPPYSNLPLREAGFHRYEELTEETREAIRKSLRPLPSYLKEVGYELYTKSF